MKKNSMSIGLLGAYFGWGGGVDFLRHLANGLLAKQQEHGLTLYLLLPVENRVESISDLLRVCKRSIKGTITHKRLWLARPRQDFHESMLDFFSHTRGGNIEIVYYESSRDGLIRCLKKIKADVVLPVNGTLGNNFPIPWVGYAPDFQHKYLPDNFSSRECFDRDIHFAKIFRDATSAIVNSVAVKDDIYKFYPYTRTNIFSLPFSPVSLPEWFEPLPYNISQKYSLPEKYFHISNQFWIHKDHLTAFKALRLGVNNDISIVCTGTMGDYRRPEYSEEVNHFLNETGINLRIRLLGHIPKRDQIEILKNAIALIQPTLFEGGPGGGSVYDAVSLGIPVILSDIPINKEVIARNTFFFRAGDSIDLADKMQILLNQQLPLPSKEELLIAGKENLEKLGDCLMEAIACAMNAEFPNKAK